ncbi:Troponin I [Portunus trituberculatus]|uniref:Troponin I n=1 Tax=Portunus trituberculatus TaxID=210409 RepID=A0A5B7DSQ5_PORTR|nr:Troponin I [Portunus trituberculatus]
MVLEGAALWTGESNAQFGRQGSALTHSLTLSTQLPSGGKRIYRFLLRGINQLPITISSSFSLPTSCVPVFSMPLTVLSVVCPCSIKPTLKKVSKYENKFAKLQKKAAEFNFRNQLKTVKKKEFELEDDKEKNTEMRAQPFPPKANVNKITKEGTKPPLVHL